MGKDNRKHWMLLFIVVLLSFAAIGICSVMNPQTFQTTAVYEGF